MASASVAELPPSPPGRMGWPWTEAPPPPPPPGDWPRITVVTPSYGQAEYVEETIRSVLLQGYPDLEFLVIDGGSRDGTVDILERYSPWITFWVSEPDRGQTHAINKGLERATGDYFAYLNSDDLLAPGALFAVAKAFGDDPETDVVYGGCRYVDQEGREMFVRRASATRFAEYLPIWRGLRRGEYLTQPEVFCRTEAVRAAGGFREELHSVMDFDMWLRLLARGASFRGIDPVLAHFRNVPGQKSAVDPGDELARVVSEYLEDPASPLSVREREAIRAELQPAHAEWLLRAALAAYELGDSRRWLTLWLRAGRRTPHSALRYPFWSVIAQPLKRALPSLLVRQISRARQRA